SVRESPIPYSATLGLSVSRSGHQSIAGPPATAKPAPPLWAVVLKCVQLLTKLLLAEWLASQVFASGAHGLPLPA
ncbi:MAG: hypothetical protein ACK557_01240, partial [Planctomycetota bacterium]